MDESYSFNSKKIAIELNDIIKRGKNMRKIYIIALLLVFLINASKAETVLAPNWSDICPNEYVNAKKVRFDNFHYESLLFNLQSYVRIRHLYERHGALLRSGGRGRAARDRDVAQRAVGAVRAAVAAAVPSGKDDVVPAVRRDGEGACRCPAGR